MTVKETNIFDLLYDKWYFDINKPIRLFEAFSGIGTQAMALKRLGYQVDHIGISEIDKHALKSYYAIHGEVKNYGGIGSFERMPKDIDICSWSFPCQDISLAGKQRGMVDGSRSNYGYVFLDTIENTPYEERPKVLLMENVKALLSQTFSEDWKEINLRLERLGYKNYAESLIATDFGVPQTRDRVFIVSIKGEYSYTFPKPFKLQKKLKDYLEDEVDEKYFLSDKQIKRITESTFTQAAKRIHKSDGDGVYIDRPHQKRGVVQKDKIQTIKTSANDIGVVVEYKLFDYMSSEKFRSELGNEIAPTIKTRNHLAVAVKDTENYLESNVLGSIDNPLRIRKLTPLEAWRLMGIDDEDFYKAKASGVSDSQLYKQAGNAIVVDVLYYIFKQFIKGERK
jgi:DNA (cytosine-5)-methyltransferase 1